MPRNRLQTQTQTSKRASWVPLHCLCGPPSIPLPQASVARYAELEEALAAAEESMEQIVDAGVVSTALYLVVIRRLKRSKALTNVQLVLVQRAWGRLWTRGW